MSNIDDRIVFMQFDNAAFERKLAETVKSLNDLNKTIEKAGKNKGLVEVGKHAKEINFDKAKTSASNLGAEIGRFRLHTIVDQVSSVSAGFLAMSTVAITALSQITQAAFSAGASITKALTITPMLDGLSEYETNMNSIQTIQANTASKGTTMKEIKAALQDLNEYSDKTIYNFGQMAKNIGTFTAAGVDLETSTNAIKGIANLSAMSGASADDASRAMYQLSQALSAGRVTLMDWNSVVNSNIGGEIFKKTLFETGKALGTLKNADMGTTFEEWEKKGGKFRDQLKDEWITADVLTQALGTFTGDYSRTQLRAMGYTEEQTKMLMEQAKTAVDAATKIKTFTQMMGALKESVGTGWATSAMLIFGDFDEAKKMWSGFYNYFTGIIGGMAEKRNELLLGWKDMGGRASMIRGIVYLFGSLKKILDPIKLAFREIFPATSVGGLLKMTKAFEDWAKFLKPTYNETQKIHTLFKGFFAALRVGWEIIKRGIETIKNLWDISGSGGRVMDLLMSLANFFINFEKNAIGPMGSIDMFFTNLAMWIRNPMSALQDLIDWLQKFFDKISTSKGAADVLGQVGEKFGFLKGILVVLGNVGSFVVGLFADLPHALATAFNGVQDFFNGVMDALAGLGSKGGATANNAGKVIGLGLLGGIFLQLRKLVKKGGDNPIEGIKKLLSQASGVLDDLTDTLKAMQTKLKASALQNIAVAIGILAISILLLSSVDPVALENSLIALGVGMGELIGAMKLVDKYITGKGALKLIAVAFAMMLLAGAMSIMAAAIRRMGEIDPKVMAKGLLGIGVALLEFAWFMKLVEKSNKGIVRTGLGLIFLSIALLILSQAVKAFGNMDWKVMGKGLLGVAGALVAVALGMWAMPPGMLSQSVALVAVAVALNIMAFAVQKFGTMKWDVLKQGILAVAAALVVIGIAMWAMPRDMILTATSLLVVGVALNIIGAAIAGLGKMGTGNLVKGIAGIAATLLILGAAAYFMGNPTVLLGALAITVLAGAVMMLAWSLEMLSNLSIAQLAAGIVAITLLLAALGGVSALLTPVIPSIFSLAAAVFVLGLGIAAFGFGIQMLGQGLMLIGKAGPKAFAALLKGVRMFIKAGPELITNFLKAVDAMLRGVERILPTILRIVGKVILGILDIVKQGVPKVVDILGEIFDGFIKLAWTRGPMLIRTIVMLFDQLVRAIADKAPSIAQSLIDMLTGVMDTVANNAGKITDSLGNLLVKVFEGLADNVGPVVDALVGLLVAALEAISENVDDIVKAYVGVWLAIFKAIGENAGDLVKGFVGMLVDILKAVLDGMEDIVDAFVDIVVEMINRTANAVKRISDAVGNLMDAIGDAMIQAAKDSTKLIEAGRTAIETFAQGLDENLPAICRAAGRIMGRLILCIPEAFGALLAVGAQAIGQFISGIGSRIGELTGKGSEMVGKIVSGAGSVLSTVSGIGASIIGSVISGITSLWNMLSGAGSYIVEGIKNGISSGWSTMMGWLEGLYNQIPAALRKLLEMRSPSRVMMRLGVYIGEGLAIGVKKSMAPIGDIVAESAEKSIATVGDRTARAVIDAKKKLAMGFDGIGFFNPTITPELDLSKVELGARRIGDILDYASLDTSVAFDQATQIASVAMDSLAAQQAPGTSETVINFEQNLHSPVALPAKYVFRKTKSALAKTKEELEIP